MHLKVANINDKHNGTIMGPQLFNNNNKIIYFSFIRPFKGEHNMKEIKISAVN